MRFWTLIVLEVQDNFSLSGISFESRSFRASIVLIKWFETRTKRILKVRVVKLCLIIAYHLQVT